MEFFSNPSGAHKWCAQNFPPIFEFSQFLTAIYVICGATYQPKCELCTASEREKRGKPCRNWPINGNAMRSRGAPLELTVLRTPSVTNKQKTKLETKASPM